MWEAIKYVSGGATLLAFLAGAVVAVLKSLIHQRERIIKAAQGDDRVRQVESALEFFQVDTETLSPEQRYELALVQIRQRARRFSQIIILIAFIFAVGLAGTIFAITRGTNDHKLNPAEQAVMYQLNAINRIHSDYIAADQEGAPTINVVLSEAPAAAQKLAEIKDSNLGLDYKIVKHSYRAFALAMASKWTQGDIQNEYATESIDEASNALELIQQARSESATGDPVAVKSHEWLDDDHEQERIMYYQAMCYAECESQTNNPEFSMSESILLNLYKLNPSYLTIHPPSQNKYLKMPWEQVKNKENI